MTQTSSLSRLILAVDDDQDNLTLMTRTLEFEGYRVQTASNGEEALEKLNLERPDLILLDINMPGINGLETLKRMRLQDEYVSVVFVSAQNGTHDIITGLDCGADDYICKPFNPLELLARVRTQLRIKDLNDKLASANRRLLELVDIDDLTGLYNMRSIFQRIENELSRARRYNRSLSVVMMDMDNFKNVNDGNDHLFGSYVLSEVGKIIQSTIRSVDFGARYGGDEFLITLPETPQDGAMLFCERLRRNIEERTFEKDGQSIRLTASIGLCSSEMIESDIDARNLVRVADHALYEAKRAGKNCTRAYIPVQRNFKKSS